MQQTSLSQLLSQSFRAQTSEFYTALPCIVITVHSSLNDCRVDVQPVVDKLFKDDTTKAQPPILSVPVVFPSSQSSALTFPIAVGDNVLCVFSQRSLDIFKSGDGRAAPPLDFRRFSARDAIAIPGLNPFSKSINNPAKRTLTHSTQDTVIAHNLGKASEVEVRLKADGSIVLNAPSNNITVNAKSANINSPTTTWNGNITQSGDYTINGTLTINGIVFEAHAHGGVQSGSSVSGGVAV